jgi:hypothetical protein
MLGFWLHFLVEVAPRRRRAGGAADLAETRFSPRPCKAQARTDHHSVMFHKQSMIPVLDEALFRSRAELPRPYGLTVSAI